MELPFSRDAFFSLFADYNGATWPAVVVAYVLVATWLGIAAVKRHWSGTVAAILLGVLWLWNGVAYHLIYFTTINAAAFGFGALFVLQSALFFYGSATDRLQFEDSRRLARSIAALLIFYGIALYSLAGIAAGHTWPRMPLFGTAPCPTTIFTLGLLTLAASSAPWWLALIPLIWAAIGTSAALLLGVYEDLGVLVAAVSFLYVRLRKGT